MRSRTPFEANAPAGVATPGLAARGFVDIGVVDAWVDELARRDDWTASIPWEQLRNRPLTLREKAVVREFYAGAYQQNWNYNARHPWHEVIAKFRFLVANTVFGSLGKTLDGGCASGEVVRAFRAEGVDCWGFDLCPDLPDVAYPEARPFLRMGRADAIPFEPSDGFRTFVSYDVFEHVPIDCLERLPAELLRLGVTQAALVISNDTISPGHITIQSVDYYERLFAGAGFRILHELTPMLDPIPTPAGWNPTTESVIWAEYRRTGEPRNGWNAVPGHLFLRRD
ncbi:MAG: hypothetical protein KDC87_06070 [Planctomycetes bacterium]|nr:hypothetical protein [Planctomycetota bacterium]